MFNWKVKFTIKIGSGSLQSQIKSDIDIDNPSDQEIFSSPSYKGDRDWTRQYLVRLKADEIVTKICNRYAVKSESATSYEIDSLDFMEDDVKIYSVVYGDPVTIYVHLSPIMSEADFLSFEQEVSTNVNDIFDRYCYVYNKSLNSEDIFEKYKLLFCIAESEIDADKKKKENKYIELRAIRNMLSHPRIDDTSLFKTIEKLFGPGVRSIDLSNPDHKSVVQDHLPSLMRIAKSIIDGLK
jgi:hypothetical protein